MTVPVGRAALRWFWTLYCRPKEAQRLFEGMGRWQAVGTGCLLYLQALPVAFAFTFTASLGWMRALGRDEVSLWQVAVDAAVRIADVSAVGIAVGIAIGIAGGIAAGIAFGIAAGSAVGIAGGSAFGIAFGSAGGGVAGLGGLAAGLAAGIAGGLAGGLAITRAYYFPLGIALVWPRLRPQSYHWHPVAWDDLCSIPFPRLDKLLMAYAERHPEKGRAEIARLIDTYPTQRGAALRAQTMLLAREAGQAAHLAMIEGAVASLPEGDKGFLAQTATLKERVSEIAALQRRLDATDRPIFREPYADVILAKIQAFAGSVSGFQEPLRTGFREAARNWERLAEQQLHQIRAVIHKQPAQQIFRAGDPVDRDREAFLPRDGVTGEIEQQLMLSTGCPGLLLYGRRRVGKSTVLKNLQGFLPENVRVVILDAQLPSVFESLASFTASVARAIEPQLPADRAPEGLQPLFEFLARHNDQLTAKGQRLVLAIDEYEQLDRKIGEGVFPLDLLDTLRASVQAHRAITWVLAGGHEVTQLTHAPWTSYLVSLRTINVPVFTAAETRLLLTDPAKYSSLWRKDAPGRPRFPESFWGDGGLDRIHRETGGWPHLVQLVAETYVDLVNESDDTRVDPALLNRALDKSIERGHLVLYELMHRECAIEGEWEYLEGFRDRESQPPPTNPRIARSLRHRQLIAEQNGDWRLRVPLMRRWLIERG